MVQYCVGKIKFTVDPLKTPFPEFIFLTQVKLPEKIKR